MLGEIVELFAFIVTNEKGEEEVLTINNENVAFQRFMGVWTADELKAKQQTADDFGKQYRVCIFRRSEHF